MFSVKEVAPPKKRAVFRGYRAEISVSKMFEPRKKTLVVLLPDPSLLVSVIPQVRLREELHDDLWRAMDDKEGSDCRDRRSVG